MQVPVRALPSSPPRHGWRRRALAAVVAALMGAALLVANVTTASAATVDTNAWYVLVNRTSGKALDVYNMAT
ncbi:RICIN domain-containing protein, partial [Streptosporangium sp. DT93]